MARLETSASRAWVIASMPVSAVMCGGMEAVTRGSQIAISGIISMLPRPCFMPSSPVITTERETSLAVPEVEGMQQYSAF